MIAIHNNKSIRSLGFALVFTLLFLAGADSAQACRFTCSVGPGGSVHPTDNGWTCEAGPTGGVEAGWEGCDEGGGRDTGGGGVGGGGGEVYLPDLTASGVSPQSASVSQAQTYTATITNTGNAQAGDSVTRFQRATNAVGDGAYEIALVDTAALAPGASRNVSFSYTFTSPGSQYVRACADSTGVVSEGAEGNNCGEWTRINVSGPAPAVDLTANPESITLGASSLLRWAANNADVCSSTQFDTLGATSGQVSVNPGETTVYSIICRKDGSGSSGTYRYSFSDTSDMACPVTESRASVVFAGMPNCPANPEGKACTSSCKINRAGEYPGGCAIYTDVYECNFSSGTPSQQTQDSVTVSVTSTGTDLTAGSATAPGVARGRTVSVTAPILNLGGTAAGASRAYYELTAPSPKQNASNVVAIGGIAASGSQNASFSYTFSNSGNYQVRFCADWYGEVAETNEGNNCGPWTEISVPETPVSDSVSCTVNTTSVTTGQSVTYSANPVGAATSPYTWTPSDGVGSYGSGQTATRTFSTPGSYGMQLGATNVSGSTNCPVVTVAGGYCTGSATVSITASPARVRVGQATTVSWNASNVPGANASCTVTGPGISWTSAVSSSPQCSVTSSATVTISTQSTYTLSCPGAAPATVTVNVIPNFQEF